MKLRPPTPEEIAAAKDILNQQIAQYERPKTEPPVERESGLSDSDLVVELRAQRAAFRADPEGQPVPLPGAMPKCWPRAFNDAGRATIHAILNALVEPAQKAES